MKPGDLADDPRLGTSAFLLNTIDLAPRSLPSRPGAYTRISYDPYGLETGVDRQDADCDQLDKRLGWGSIIERHRYRENDTSAYKKRRVTLADGSRAWRVIRPEFTRLLADLDSGEIDGVIVYDLDRLMRQPRDLEDLIDIVEHRKVPVQSVQGSIDLMTSNGRAMARVLVAMAAKSSDDTSRRVARAAVEDARSGKLKRGGPRRYGWMSDGTTLIADEVAVIREIVERVMDGQKLTQIALDLQGRGIPTVGGREWTRTTINTILRNPRLAGIRGYTGRFHAEKPKLNEWWKRVVRVDGEYVLGDWQPILEVEEWEALQNALDSLASRGVRDIETPIASGRKHLLSGICVCGKCGVRMIGKKVRGLQMYGCRPKDMGGCNGVSRNKDRVDRLILSLVIAALENDNVSGSPRKGRRLRSPQPDTSIEQRKATLRTAWSNGQISDDDFFATMSELNARSSAAVAAASVASRVRRLPNRATAARELRDEDVPMERKRAIISSYIEKIIINPSTRGPHFNPDDVVPVWRETE